MAGSSPASSTRPCPAGGEGTARLCNVRSARCPGGTGIPAPGGLPSPRTVRVRDGRGGGRGRRSPVRDSVRVRSQLSAAP